jgi:hypothetical protein
VKLVGGDRGLVLEDGRQVVQCTEISGKLFFKKSNFRIKKT